jgi:hypothetical protein
MNDTPTRQTPNVIFNLKYDPYSKTRNPFSSCKANGRKRNIVDYVHGGAKESMNIVDYTGNKEKSAGAFDRKGLMTEERLEGMKEKLRKTHSVIWRGVISFEGEFGDCHIRCFEDAYSLMKTQFPKFIKAAGLDYGNVVWFAAMHRNTLNRHIHLVFFERRGTHKRKGHKVLGYSRGKLPPESFADFKFNMESYLTGTWRDVVIARDNVLIFNGVRDNEKTKKLYLGGLQKEMLQLINSLPEEGSLAYNSDNMTALRPLIDSISKLIIYADPVADEWYGKFLSAAYRRDRETIEQCRRYGLNPAPRLLADKMKTDLFARMGNKVIAFARANRNNFDSIEAKRFGRIATKHIKRRSMNGMFDSTLWLAGHLSSEPRDFFNEYLAKLKQYEIEERQLECRHQKQSEMEM